MPLGIILTRFKLPLIQPIGEIALFAYLIPPILLLVPIARLVGLAGLANSRAALLVIYTANMLPFGLWVLRAHFLGIAADLEEAAMIDGCSRFGAFARVIIPQAVPGLISAGVFTFNASWSEYLYASTLLNSPDKLTLSPGLAMLMDQTDVYSWGVLMAGSVIMVLPLVLQFALAQQQLVGGPLGATTTVPIAVKGIAFGDQNVGLASALAIVAACFLIVGAGVYSFLYRRSERAAE